MNDRSYGNKVGTLSGIVGAITMVSLLYWSRYCSFSFKEGLHSDLVIIFITAIAMIVFARKSGGILSTHISTRYSWIGVGALYGFVNLLFTTGLGAIIFVVSEGEFAIERVLTAIQAIGLVMMITGVMAVIPSMFLGLIFGYVCDRKIDRSGYV